MKPLCLALVALGTLSCTAVYDADDFGVCKEPDCPDTWVTGAQPAACERETWTCIQGCGDDDECVVRCLGRDSNPLGCLGCAINESIVCGRDNGCRCEWDDVRCCRAESGCAVAGECLPCADEQEAWDTCLSTIRELCVDELVRCVAD